MDAKQSRAEKVNNLIILIANRGERFFFYKGSIDWFSLDLRRRVWFNSICPETKIFAQDPSAWPKAGLGRTMTDLCRDFYLFIAHGQKVPAHRFGPWPQWMCGGDLWGYGDDMEEIRKTARELGIID